MKTKMDLGPDPDQRTDPAGNHPQNVFQDGLSHQDQNKKTEQPGPADYDEAITACGYGKFNYILILTLIPVSCAQVFASGSVSFVVPSAECDLELTNFHKGALNASGYIGMILSSFVWGFFADVFGRRKIVILGYGLTFTFDSLSAFSHEFWLFLLLRICVGLSVTGANTAVVSYLAETHTREHRPKTMMYFGGLCAVGQVIQPILAYLLIPIDLRFPLISGVLDFTSWRLFILACSSMAFISSSIFIFYYSETPKFLMSQGQTTKALEAFQRIYTMNTGNPATLYPIKELQSPSRAAERQHISSAPVKPGGVLTVLRNGFSQVRPIFSPPYVKIALLLVAMQMSTTICFNSLRMWTPQLFATLDRASSEVSPQVANATTLCDLLMFVPEPSSEESPIQTFACLPIKGEVYLRSLLIGILATCCYIISTPLVGLIGQKVVARICILLGAVSSLSMYWTTSSNIFMGLLGVYIGVVQITLTILSSIAVGFFPTDFRSVAVSLQQMSGRSGSMIGNLLFPVFLSISCSAVFFTLSGILVCIMIATFCLPNKEEKN